MSIVSSASVALVVPLVNYRFQLRRDREHRAHEQALDDSRRLHERASEDVAELRAILDRSVSAGEDHILALQDLELSLADHEPSSGTPEPGGLREAAAVTYKQMMICHSQLVVRLGRPDPVTAAYHEVAIRCFRARKDAEERTDPVTRTVALKRSGELFTLMDAFTANAQRLVGVVLDDRGRHRPESGPSDPGL